MEQHNIGTDATVAEHIQKQLDRGYATKDANLTFWPTPLGEALVGAYRKMGLENLWLPNLRQVLLPCTCFSSCSVHATWQIYVLASCASTLASLALHVSCRPFNTCVAWVKLVLRCSHKQQAFHSCIHYLCALNKAGTVILACEASMSVVLTDCNHV